jgi:hypothetical protein
MNYGALLGFTKIRNIEAGGSYPEMKVLYVPSTSSNYVLTPGNIDTLLLVDSPSPRTLLGLLNTGSGMKEGQAIHVAQWGAEAVSIQSETGAIVRVATGLARSTRAQYSVISLMKVVDESNEWLVFGDLASA